MKLIIGSEQNKMEFGFVSLISLKTDLCFSFHDASITFGWCFQNFITPYGFRPITLHKLNVTNFVYDDTWHRYSTIEGFKGVISIQIWIVLSRLLCFLLCESLSDWNARTCCCGCVNDWSYYIEMLCGE